MSTKIYFDMDGVLADFDRAAVPYSDGRKDLNNRPNLMSVDAATAKRDRWRRIESVRTFWADIPEIPDIGALLSVVAPLGELYVLTSLPSYTNFIGGAAYVNFIAQEKRAWIARHMSEYFAPERVIVTRIAKEKLIHPGASDILIDDRLVNVADWMAAGGRGVVFRNVPQTIKDLTLLGF